MMLIVLNQASCGAPVANVADVGGNYILSVPENIAGVPLTAMAKAWEKYRGEEGVFASFLDREHGFPHVHRPERPLITRLINEAHQDPYGGRERYRGRFIAYGKGLVIFDDAAESPNLSGPVLRYFDKFMSWPFRKIADPSRGMQACYFGDPHSNRAFEKLKPGEATFRRQLTDDIDRIHERPDLNGSEWRMRWTEIGEWLDHWLTQ
ncbi:MAG: hypothetical protein V4480_02535 [Patescibacteria group bacterium]